MKFCLYAVLLCSSIFLYAENIVMVDLKSEPICVNKPKILVLMSRGGGGHVAVSNALKGYLQDAYDVRITNFFDDVMSSIDTIKFITFGQMSGEDFYNFCLQYRFINLINSYVRLGAWGFRYKRAEIEQYLEQYVHDVKPDLVISVIPLINAALVGACQKKNVPCIVLTNDLDTTNYINGFADPEYKRFFYTLPFDDAEMWKKIEPAGIPKEQIRITGFPLRPDFFKSYDDLTNIKKDFNIPIDKKNVMILMGGAGSYASARFVSVLARSKNPKHLIVCIGRNEKIRSHIEKIVLPSHITLSIVGFTSRIAELMAVSDILITKPGPGSICEAIAMNLPVILDQTTGVSFWEQMNIDLVKKHGFGNVINKFRELNELVDYYVDNPKALDEIKQRMIEFKQHASFDQCIKSLIEEALSI